MAPLEAIVEPQSPLVRSLNLAREALHLLRHRHAQAPIELLRLEGRPRVGGPGVGKEAVRSGRPLRIDNLIGPQ
jgi:hypothetical protein